jgi:chromosome condensin MukBEF MukE localization factor
MKGIRDERAERERRRELVRSLERAGLELWRAPEGFWAIRPREETEPEAKVKPRRRAR